MTHACSTVHTATVPTRTRHRLQVAISATDIQTSAGTSGSRYWNGGSCKSFFQTLSAMAYWRGRQAPLSADVWGLHTGCFECVSLSELSPVYPRRRTARRAQVLLASLPGFRAPCVNAARGQERLLYPWACGLSFGC